MKSFFRRIHLYLGLISGLFIMLLCLTGAILVFEKEIDHTLYSDRYYVKPVDGGHLPLKYISFKFREHLPDAEIKSFKVYADPERSMEIQYTLNNVVPSLRELEVMMAAKKEGKSPEAPRKTAFVNPYNAQVIELHSSSESFFHQVEQFHRFLAGGKIGKLITGVSTLLFLVILITGIILWWPKTRAKFEKRFIVKWNSGWKRLNHDFHIVLGFYSAIFLFIFAFTALAWSFKWFNNRIYLVTGSEMKPPKQVETVFIPEKEKVGADSVVQLLNKEIQSAQFFQLSMPKDSTGTYSLNILPQGAYEMQTVTYWVDPFSGKVLDKQAFADKNLGQQVRASFKPIHTSSIFGWTSKLIGFFVCLLGVTFPVTGFILWRNRLAKKK